MFFFNFRWELFVNLNICIFKFLWCMMMDEFFVFEEIEFGNDVMGFCFEFVRFFYVMNFFEGNIFINF